MKGKPHTLKICLLRLYTHIYHLGDSSRGQNLCQPETTVHPGCKSKPTLSPWASRSGIYGNQALGSTDSTKKNTTQLALERMQISIDFLHMGDRSHHWVAPPT